LSPFELPIRHQTIGRADFSLRQRQVHFQQTIPIGAERRSIPDRIIFYVNS